MKLRQIFILGDRISSRAPGIAEVFRGQGILRTGTFPLEELLKARHVGLTWLIHHLRVILRHFDGSNPISSFFLDER